MQTFIFLNYWQTKSIKFITWKQIFCNSPSCIKAKGATTVSIMTFSITILSIMTFSITILSVTTYKRGTRQNGAQHKGRVFLCWVSIMLSVIYAKSHVCWVSCLLSLMYAECHVCFVIMLSIVCWVQVCWVSCLQVVMYDECYVCWVSLCWA